jgi:hypothetical protein
MNLINRYPTDNNLYNFEKIITDLKRRIFTFEMGSFKSKEKIANLNKDIESTLQTLKSQRDMIKGFNWWFFLFGFCLYHMGTLYYTKRLLYELNRGEYIRHLALCTLSGISLGSLIGYRYSYDIGVYNSLRRAENKLAYLARDFEYYYILNKEQEFED